MDHYIEPIIWGNEANDKGGIGVDFSFFRTEKAKVSDPIDTSEVEKKKKTTRATKVISESDITGVVNPIPGSDVANVDYDQSYRETNDLLRTAIAQTDKLSFDIEQEIDAIKSSKTIKNKYTYITNMTSSASSLLSTKIMAIREMNSSITQAHNLNLNRLKALKLDKDKENDDMKMMDIYSAFVNTPIGTYSPSAAAPNIQDLTVGINSGDGSVTGINMVPNNGFDTGAGLTPEQNRMRLESNPNIQVVVRFNQSSGMRYFDVIDSVTGASIPNYPRPDNFLLEDTTIDVNSRIARNRNVNTVWPLIVEGDNTFITEY